MRTWGSFFLGFFHRLLPMSRRLDACMYVASLALVPCLQLRSPWDSVLRILYEPITVNSYLCKWRRCLAASSSFPSQTMWKRSARTAPLPVPFPPVSGPSLFGVQAR
ncbi:hypothetical protein GGI42DRAFT_58469 [Trichoderma sp. SZMC 28013]